MPEGSPEYDGIERRGVAAMVRGYEVSYWILGATPVTSRQLVSQIRTFWNVHGSETEVWEADLLSNTLRLRKSVSDAEENFSCRYRKIVGSIHTGRDYHSVFYGALQAWLITFVIVVGWLIASAIITVRFFAP